MGSSNHVHCDDYPFLCDLLLEEKKGKREMDESAAGFIYVYFYRRHLFDHFNSAYRWQCV